MRYTCFIRADIDYINAHAAWTADQAELFPLLMADKWTDAGIMIELNMSHARYYRTKKEIEKKVERIIAEKRKKTGILVPIYRGKIR